MQLMIIKRQIKNKNNYTCVFNLRGVPIITLLFQVEIYNFKKYMKSNY